MSKKKTYRVYRDGELIATGLSEADADAKISAEREWQRAEGPKWCNWSGFDPEKVNIWKQ